MTAATVAERPAGALRRLVADRPEIVLFAVFAALYLLTGAKEHGFLSGDQLSTTVLFAAPLALLAAGQTLVMLTGGIDLSVANTATAAAYIMSAHGHKGVLASVAIGLAIGLAVGLVNGVGVAVFGVQPLIMTLGMAAVTLGFLVVGAQTWFKHAPLVPEEIHTLGSERFFGYVPYNLLVWAPIALAIILGLRYTGFGRMVYAVGDNREACRLAGVRVWQVEIAVYVLCGVLSAIAGILVLGFNNAADLGLVVPFLLPSIAAVVIGGTSIFGGSGGYGGTILGALILVVLDSLLTLLDASAAVKQMLYGGIVLGLAALYARVASPE